MPSFKLDGQDIPFEPGDSIIKAAWRQGIEIPHYCWHPGLSAPANCRMCLVEIKSERQALMPVLKWDESKKEYVPDTKPKLMPACQMPAVEGQEVFAKNDEASAAQSHVQEFLLLNHPVDCPICDQAGECKLQDYWLESQGKLKRKLTEPVHKPKAVRFGPTIVYDAERCIMCTRCIRVCDEVANDHVLDMRERGNRNEIVLSPDRQLDHQYTFMTEHVCPVGALTTRDFRFKARVWFLRSGKSVCEGCATGCNDFVDYDPRDQTVHRLRPRDNEQVNKFWMCDDGMMSYKTVRENRVTQGVTRNGSARATTPTHALQVAASKLSKADGGRLAVIFSAVRSSEDNFALAQIAKLLGAQHLYLAGRAGWAGDDILRDADNNPNRRGAIAAAGAALAPLSKLMEDVAAGKVDAVLALGAQAELSAGAMASLRALSTFVALVSNRGPLPDIASTVIPIAHHIESAGTFVNRQNVAQRFEAVIPPPQGVLPGWQTIAALGKELGKELPFNGVEDVRNAMNSTTQTVPPEARA